ncbi:MAG: hypothetical protein IPP49_07170 [Saprospiraceae bacterium]|nr:hypothetical protein [Saprospiraceae bacterium]
MELPNALPKNASWKFLSSAQSMDATNHYHMLGQIAISRDTDKHGNQNFRRGRGRM